MRLRIFLVEDSPVIRDSLIEVFEELLPARVVGWAATESDSVAWLKQNTASWDLAVVDMFLAEGNGLGVLQSCKTRRMDQRMVVFSNYATAQIRERCLIEGADAVFDKSHELEEFTAYALESVRSDLGPTNF